MNFIKYLFLPFYTAPSTKPRVVGPLVEELFFGFPKEVALYRKAIEGVKHKRERERERREKEREREIQTERERQRQRESL